MFQNNLKIVTIQWSLLVAGLAMMLIGLGLVALRNGNFKELELGWIVSSKIVDF